LLGNSTSPKTIKRFYIDRIIYDRVSQTGGSRKVFKMCFFNYIKIKNHKKWGSEKQNKIGKGSKIRQKTRIDVDANAVISSNRKQAHQSHTPHYEK
jgi:hypothetical protein